VLMELFSLGVTAEGEGVEIEMPKALKGKGVRCGQGMSPFPLVVGSEEGAVPPPQKILHLKWRNLMHITDLSVDY